MQVAVLFCKNNTFLFMIIVWGKKNPHFFLVRIFRKR